MNPKIIRIRQEARELQCVIITGATRSATGFEVSVNGHIVHQAPTKEECLSALLARLQCQMKCTWRIRAARKG